MLYLSKGIVCPESVATSLFLERGGQKFQLQGGEAAAWLKARFGFGDTESASEEQAVRHLAERGLAEAEEETTELSRYRILTRCVCCAAKGNMRMSARLGRLERQLDTLCFRRLVCGFFAFSERRNFHDKRALSSPHRAGEKGKIQSSA